MADPKSRKYAAVSRLRNSYQKKRESLADQFEYKIHVCINFYSSKEKKTKTALYECSEVLPVMTNNYEQRIMDGVKNDAYSYESTQELIDKDVVQLHTHNWKLLRNDMQGMKASIDFLLWPRADIETIQCRLYSRWKDDPGPFKHIESQFTIQSCEYEPQLKHLLTIGKKDSGLLTVNHAQNLFLFVDKHQLKLQNDKSQKPLPPDKESMKRLVIYRMRSLCLYLPQDELMNWSSETAHDWVFTHMSRKSEKRTQLRTAKVTDQKIADAVKSETTEPVKDSNQTTGALPQSERKDSRPEELTVSAG